MATATAGEIVTGAQLNGEAGLASGGIAPGPVSGAGTIDEGGGATTAQSVLAAAGEPGQSSGPQAAGRLDALERGLIELEAKLSEALQRMNAAQQAQALDKELRSAGAIDVETAAALITQNRGAGKQLDIPAQVSALKQSKPFLFRSSVAGGVMGPSARRDPLTQLAQHAVATGDKRALLEYLRARRGS